MGFDTRSLIGLRFPSAVCPRCAAIVKSSLVAAKKARCEVCGQVWVLSEGAASWKEFLSPLDCWVEITLEHARALAWEVWFFEERRKRRGPLSALFSLLNKTKHFVHFATWNISDTMIGALAMVGKRVPVRGIVGAAEARQQELLDKLAHEIPHLKIVVCGDKGSWGNLPHQKVLVFDGIVGVEGSANLTPTAWAKVEEGLENIRFTTDLDEVRELNNRYIAAHWRSPSKGLLSDELLADETWPWSVL